MTDELIEQVARAIRQALSDGAPWDSEPEDFIEEAKVCAPAAIAAINLPAQLETARTQGWNEAIEAAADVVPGKIAADTNIRDYITTFMDAYFAIRALTKENSDASSD